MILIFFSILSIQVINYLAYKNSNNFYMKTFLFVTFCGLALMFYIPAINFIFNHDVSISINGMGIENNFFSSFTYAIYTIIYFNLITVLLSFSSITQYLPSKNIVTNHSFGSIDCLFILFFFNICNLYFFFNYYGDIATILLLRTHDLGDISIAFEISRSLAIISLCIFIYMIFEIKSLFFKALIFISIILSFLIIFTFGSRNFFLYPIFVFLLLTIDKENIHKGMLDMNIFGFKQIIFISFVIFLVFIQSIFRGIGIDNTNLEFANGIGSVLLAFDSLSALILIIDSEGFFIFNELPFNIILDLFLYFIPSFVFELFGAEKDVNTFFILWSENITGSSVEESNVTPSIFGQFILSSGIISIIFMPFIFYFTYFIFIYIFTKFGINNRIMLGMLMAATFNSFRMMSGVYYFFLMTLLCMFFILWLVSYAIPPKKIQS